MKDAFDKGQIKIPGVNEKPPEKPLIQVSFT